MLVPPHQQRMLIPIDVYLDFICPWCYMQTRSLRAAMTAFVAQHPEVEFELTWRPFYVAPLLRGRCRPLDLLSDDTTTTTSTSTSTSTPADRLARLRAASARHGIDLNLDGDNGSGSGSGVVTGPTRAAHKLVALALRRGGPAAQAAMVERLLRAQLVQGRDISDEETLVRLAGGYDDGDDDGDNDNGNGQQQQQSLGLLLARQDVLLELADDDASRRVDRQVEHARETLGIEAVPCVTVLGRFKVGGYQEPRVFGDLFAKIYEQKIC